MTFLTHVASEKCGNTAIFLIFPMKVTYRFDKKLIFERILYFELFKKKENCSVFSFRKY